MSRQLRNLLKQIRVLEEKIFYEPRKSDWREQLITTQELSDALSSLSNRIIENQSEALCVLRLLNDVEQLRGRPLPAFEKNALQVVEILFNYLRENVRFDPLYYHVLNSLQLAFTRLSLNDLSFLDNPKHIAVRFLEKLLTLDHHFDRNTGKLAQYFIQAIVLLIDRLANREQVTNQTFMMANQKIDGYFEGFNNKNAANTSLILNDVEKESRIAQANRYTRQLIKNKTQGEEIPIFLLNFFENQIAPILHKTITQYGTSSKQCQQLLTDMDTLTWSITYPFSNEDYRQRFEADVSEAMKRLYQICNLISPGDQAIKTFFFEAETLQNKKLQGQRVNYDVMISADIFDDEDFGGAQSSSWLDEPAQDFIYRESLQEGNWYYLTHNQETTRSKLLMINELTEQLIFTNLSGELVLNLSFKEGGYLEKKLESAPVNEKTEYKHAIKALVRELNSKLEILNNEYRLFLVKKEKQAKDREEVEKTIKLAIKQRVKDDKYREVMKRQQQAREETDRQTKERQQEELTARQRFHIKGIYRKLTPGTIVAYRSASGNWKEASLTLISKTTQKHIFSDNRGNKVLEPTKAELLALIETQCLKVLKQAGQSADPLQSLVKERRKKLQQI